MCSEPETGLPNPVLAVLEHGRCGEAYDIAGLAIVENVALAVGCCTCRAGLKPWPARLSSEELASRQNGRYRGPAGLFL